MVMEGKRFATLICEDLAAVYEGNTFSSQRELTIECAGLKVRPRPWPPNS